MRDSDVSRVSKTFRIFVSSTFSDLKAERNALQERVFPRLRKLCMAHGWRFQAIDLRWGVSEEAGLDQQTMNICLQELKRCQKVTPRPNFIVLLGDRYGWQPLQPQIPADEFEEILTAVTGPDDQELILCPEPPKHPRKGWYRKDLNAVPPEYSLRPRELDIPENATDEEKKAIRDREAEDWRELENRMRGILLGAIDKLGWSPHDPCRTKYEASATHQEILHGALSPQVKDAHEHVFGFFRCITNLDQLERDLDKAQADPDKEARNFVDHFLGPDGKKHIDRQAHDRLDSLKKEELEPALPGNIHNYEATWTGSGITEDHLAQLCNDVERRLSEVILSKINEHEAEDPLKAEIAEHVKFGNERARFFTGRNAPPKEIADYLRNLQNRHPLVIHGESGSGKSALMAQTFQQACDEPHHRQAKKIVRFIGATPGSCDLRSLLTDLCREIGVEDVPSDMNELVKTFCDRLSAAEQSEKKEAQQGQKEQEVVLFLDALDQLNPTDNARMLYWLPRKLAPGVKLVMSVLTTDHEGEDRERHEDCFDIVRQRWAESLIELGPLHEAAGEELLKAWLKEVGRALQHDQKQDVLDKFSKCPLPIYLKLAFVEARRWKSWEGVPTTLSDTVEGILVQMLTRLERPEDHGDLLVGHALGYIATGKNGLTEDEVLDVLSADKEVMADFVRRSPESPPVDRLPVVIWSRLFADIESYMTRRRADGTIVLDFYHRQVGKAVEKRYLSGNARLQAHLHLAKYFDGLDYWAESLDEQRKRAKRLPPTPRPANIRKVVELPFHRIEAAKLGGVNDPNSELWDAVADLLTDWQFLEAKAEADPNFQFDSGRSQSSISTTEEKT